LKEVGEKELGEVQDYHAFNIKKAILKTIGEIRTNTERIENILVVVSRRGIMLNLAEDKLKIN